MIEAKMKELAIFRLYDKYPDLSCKISNTETILCQEIKNPNIFNSECLCCNNFINIKAHKKKRPKKLKNFVIIN